MIMIKQALDQASQEATAMFTSTEAQTIVFHSITCLVVLSPSETPPLITLEVSAGKAPIHLRRPRPFLVRI